jgi:pimeloyl-ACP methyl ester carboxylesterase
MRCAAPERLVPPVDLLHEFGGDGPLLHLAHANAYPPETYAELATRLTARYRVVGLPARPLWSTALRRQGVTWYTASDDLIAGLDRLGYRDLLGVGHSLGAVATLLGAIRRPDLFRAVVLIDPVLLPPPWLVVLEVMRALRVVDHLPVIRDGLRRRRIWPDRATCLSYFREKSQFARWSDEALRIFVQTGVRERPDGQVELRYSPDWEAHFYRGFPTDIWRYPARLRQPVLFVRGAQTDTFVAEAQQVMERLLPRAEYRVIPDAGHLVPFERPDETAAAVLGFLDRLDYHASPVS